MSSHKVAPISQQEEAALLDLAKTAFADAFPNPGRIGCPDRDFRTDLATGKRDIRRYWDVFDHICQCSPCFVEHVSFREQHSRRNLAIGAIGVAALMISLAGAYGLWSKGLRVELLATTELHRSIRPPQPPPEAFRRPVIQAQLDFSHWTLHRNDTPDSPGPLPVPLERGNLALRIRLPLFSDAGFYRIVFTDDLGVRLIDEAVLARILAGETVLETLAVDTSAVRPGIYRLTAQRQGASGMREFLVSIK